MKVSTHQEIEHVYINFPFANFSNSLFKKSVFFNCNKPTIFVYKCGLIEQIKLIKSPIKTLYIGHLENNIFPNEYLKEILDVLDLKLARNYEFSYEINPYCFDYENLALLAKSKVNRIIIKAISFNKNTLIKLNYKNLTDLKKLLDELKKLNYLNIGIDFYYGFKNEKRIDLDPLFHLIKQYEIKHINPNGIKTNALNTSLYFYLKKRLIELGFKQYEIANYAFSNKYVSKHNLAYWNLRNWKGIGFDAYSYIDGVFYRNKLHKTTKKQLCEKEIYIALLTNLLNTKKGVDLSIDINQQAYRYFKDKLDNSSLLVIKNNHLKMKQIELANEVLVKLID